MAETLKQYRSAADGEKQTQSIQEVEGEDPVSIAISITPQYGITLTV